MKWLQLVLLLFLSISCSFNLEREIAKEKKRRNKNGVVIPNEKENEKMYKPEKNKYNKIKIKG